MRCLVSPRRNKLFFGGYLSFCSFCFFLCFASSLKLFFTHLVKSLCAANPKQNYTTDFNTRMELPKSRKRKVECDLEQPHKKQIAVSRPNSISFRSQKRNGYAFLSNLWPYVPQKALKSVEQKFPEICAEVRDMRDGKQYCVCVEFEGKTWTFPSVEHAYQWRKFVNSHPSVAMDLLGVEDAYTCQKMGRKLEKRHRIDMKHLEPELNQWLMTCLLAKFKSSEPMKSTLIATEDSTFHSNETATAELLPKIRDLIKTNKK